MNRAIAREAAVYRLVNRTNPHAAHLFKEQP